MNSIAWHHTQGMSHDEALLYALFHTQAGTALTVGIGPDPQSWLRLFWRTH